MKYRIVTNGHSYFIQKRFLFLFWKTQSYKFQGFEGESRFKLINFRIVAHPCEWRSDFTHLDDAIKYIKAQDKTILGYGNDLEFLKEYDKALKEI